MATVMADSNATETAAAMINSNRNGNGRLQWQRRRATAKAMATKLAMATETETELAMVIAIATATARATMMKGGLPLHVPAMCSAVAGVSPCFHPHGHKGVCIHQRCVMGVTLQSFFAPFQGGGFLTAHHGLFFIFYKYCSVY